jgi:ParB family chromosome partitioning protein
MAAKSKTISKARLKNLDDLFNLNDGVNPLESTMPIIATQPVSKRAVTSIEIEKLTPFKGHPFRLYEGERLDDMVESIKANGEIGRAHV